MAIQRWSVFGVFVFASVAWMNCSSTSAFLFPICQDQEKSLIENGAFEQWKDDLPFGWEVGIGATDGAQAPVSRLAKGPGPSLELSGDGNTKAWRFLSQSLDAEAGQVLRVSFSAKATGLKRQGFQKDNCFVGLVPMNGKGERVGPQFWNIDSADFETKSYTVAMPTEIKKAELWIFLSKTGTLNVKDLKVEALNADDSFDVLVDDMEKNYSFLELKKIDWKALTERYRDRATKAKEPEVFSETVAEMLAELDDIHTWVMHEGKRYSNLNSTYEGNYDFEFIKRDLTDTTRFKGVGATGETKDGFFYINLGSFDGANGPPQEMIAAIIKQFDSPGFVIDVRRNGGGNDKIAEVFAGLFAKKETEFAKSTFRNGNLASDFCDPITRTFRPTGKKSYEGPVVCLIGPGTVSSAEAFVMMMKATPNCTLVGKPTRGSSGNPRPVQLPNGVEVWYSRWKSLLPDGTCIEGVGINPDIEVDHVEGKDTAYLKAVEILAKKK